jgi:hypothetical protein
MLEVGYDGMLSRKLQAQINANGGVPGIPAAQTRVPFPEYPAGIELTEGWGTGSYNGLGIKPAILVRLVDSGQVHVVESAG